MFDWGTYLDLADDLAAPGRDEAAGRSAISRAYYAAFHAGRDYLDGTGRSVSRGAGAHGEVIERVGAVAPDISQALRRLHGWRKAADYEDVCGFDVSRQAEFAVAVAKRVLASIEALT